MSKRFKRSVPRISATPFKHALQPLKAVGLAHAQALWQQGDWAALTQIELAQLAAQPPHPDRAQLCALVASAWAQAGDQATAQHFLHQALDWGCSKQFVTQLLLHGLQGTLAQAAAASSGTAPAQPAAPIATADTSGFYRAFEERFRGTRALIQQRVAVYLPFVLPIAQRYPGLGVLDLGCGRGEWLQVLKDAGVNAEGVDADAGMLHGCAQWGLRVQRADALAFLQQQATASRICISLIHVVEHLPFEVLLRIVQEARRVLVPEGILIMETPNPENFSVGACSFYIDPTHRNPLPPPLLAFVPEYFGFERIKTLRLQENPQLHAQSTYSMADVLEGISPDYAIVAQLQQPKTETIAPTETDAWNKPYGIGLKEMLQSKQAVGSP